MEIRAEFPVKGYLKHYVYWKENLDPGEVIDLSGPGQIPWVLSGILSGKMTIPSNNPLSETPSIYDARLPFLMTVEKVNRNLMFFTVEGVRYFNTFLYRDFHEAMLQSIMMGREIGISEVQIINNWIDNLEIRDMISFDALKKASYRLRKDKKMPIFRCVNSI